MSIFTLFVVTCIRKAYTYTCRAESWAGEKHGARKSVPLLTYYLYAFIFTGTHCERACVRISCDVIYTKVKWRWQLRKVRLNIRKSEEREHTRTRKAECEKQWMFCNTLNRPPPIFHESKTQTVKIETFDLWPTSYSLSIFISISLSLASPTIVWPLWRVNAINSDSRKRDANATTVYNREALTLDHGFFKLVKRIFGWYARLCKTLCC